MLSTHDNNIDTYQILRVIATITQYGSRDQDVYSLDGLSCTTSHDGYTVTLFDVNVDLSIFFHNTFDLKYKTQAALEQFQRAVNHIERQDKAGAYTAIV